MSEKELRRSLAVLPIGTVMKLTSLTARQIRYYEDQDLVHPKRSDSNRRLYSLNDIDQILEIKDYLSNGLNMDGIKDVLRQKALQQRRLSELQEEDSMARKSLRKELLTSGGFNLKHHSSISKRL